MRLSKFKLGICAGVLCLSAVGVRADVDTPAQAAARAGLMQKIQQEEGTNPPASTVPAPSSNADSAAQAAARAALLQKMQQTDGTSPSTTAAGKAPNMTGSAPSTDQWQPAATGMDTPAQAAARAALLKRMQEANGNQSPAVEVTAQGVVPTTSAMTPAEVKAIEDATAAANAKKAAEEQAEAQKMTAQKAAQGKASQDAAAAAAQTASAKEAQAAAMAASYPGKQLGFAPPQAPPVTISPEKQARLDALLLAYKADQISPAEYHKERAAIIAGP